MFLTAPDQSRVGGSLAGAQALVDRLRARWQAGMPLMADNAAAAALGQSRRQPAAAAGHRWNKKAGVVDFPPDHVIVQAGRGWVAGAGFEPRMLPDRHWGRLYNLLASDRRLLGVGVDVGTALEVRAHRRDGVGQQRRGGAGWPAGHIQRWGERRARRALRRARHLRAWRSVAP